LSCLVIFDWQYSKQYSHRHILEQKVTPIILDIEEEAKDEHQVAQADEDDRHHTAVYGEPVFMPYVLSHGLQATGTLESYIVQDPPL
jgi:hypothetical protein